MPRLMLLDSNSLIYRAYFALIQTPLTTSKGQLVNAVFGFWSIVLRGFQDVKPDYVIAAFDVSAPTFRRELYSDYKATRRAMPDDLKDQFPIVRQIIAAFGIPVYEVPGFEADDVIATLVTQAEARGIDTTIVSGDLDLLQLVTDLTTVMTTRGGVQQTTFYDPARIQERYGLSAAQMVDFKALKGDATDNIPGIPGVGEKTAATVLQRFGTLDELYGRIDEVQPEKLRAKLAEYRDDVFRWRTLVTVRADVPVDLDLDPARLGDYDRNEVLRLFREYEFRSLVERLPGITGEEARAPGDLLRAADRSAPIPAVQVAGRPSAAQRAQTGEGTGLQLSLDLSSSAAASIAQAAPSATAVAVLERPTDPLGALKGLLSDPALAETFDETADYTDWLRAQADLTLGFALSDVRPRRGELLGLAVTSDDGRVLAASAEHAARLAEQINAVGKAVAGHEVKQLLGWQLVNDATRPLPTIAFDTQIAAYALNAALRSQTLASFAAERLEVELPPDGAPGGRAHAALQAAASAAARQALQADLEKEPTLGRVLDEIELPLIPVLAQMESAGVAIDRETLAGLSKAFAEEITRLEQEIYADVGHQFTIGSRKQLEQVLFYELNLPRGRRTKTGYSTDA